MGTQKVRNGAARGEHKELAVACEDQRTSQALGGSTDNNLKVIEQALDVQIERQGLGFVIRGQDSEVDLAGDLLEQLRDLVAHGEEIFPGDIDRAIKMLAGNRRLRLKDLFRDSVAVAGRRTSIVPKTVMQKNYLEAIRTHDCVFGVGPAGTGKTYLAMAMAVAALVRREVKRIVLCRPAVEAGEKLGFLPGDMAEKVNPYLRPLYDALYDMVEFERAQEFIEKGVVEVAPLAFMRGRTLKDAFVILDEAQNTTREQMKMFLTRLGYGSKSVVTGDITQVDLPRGIGSGMVEALEILKDVEGIGFTYFTRDDVVRHPLVTRIVDAYEKAEE